MKHDEPASATGMVCATRIVCFAAAVIWRAGDAVMAGGDQMVRAGDMVGEVGHRLLDGWASVAERIEGGA